MEKIIYCVFNPNGRAPYHVHHTEQSAKDEAKRLAKIHPDTKFHVMKSIGVAVKKDVDYIEQREIPSGLENIISRF